MKTDSGIAKISFKIAEVCLDHKSLASNWCKGPAADERGSVRKWELRQYLLMGKEKWP